MRSPVSVCEYAKPSKFARAQNNTSRLSNQLFRPGNEESLLQQAISGISTGGNLSPLKLNNMMQWSQTPMLTHAHKIPHAASALQKLYIPSVEERGDDADDIDDEDVHPL